MENNVTYLIGAGASAGKRKEGVILEGLPCVADIPARLENLCNFLESIEIPIEKACLSDEFLGTDELAETRSELVKELRELREQSAKHATIDTYARKLLLTSQRSKFCRLEKLISLYFIIEQILLPPDSRYDAFFANILHDNGEMPKQINVISWNYDCQFEIAYSEYANNPLFISIKQDKIFADHAKIIKINGTAVFDNMNEDLPTLRRKILDANNKKDEKEAKLFTLIKILELYTQMADDNKMKTSLSFAFDKYAYPTEQIFDRISKIMADTKALVIIGYTFPFFNREIDRQILQAMNANTHIYIQDLYPEKIKQNLQAVLSQDQKRCPITLLQSTVQFYLPPEL